MRGRGIDDREDGFEHVVSAQENIVVPEANHAPSDGSHVRRPITIVLGLPCVLSTVELDDQPAFSANEVGKIGADLILTPKLAAAQAAVAQVEPKPCFGIALISP